MFLTEQGESLSMHPPVLLLFGSHSGSLMNYATHYLIEPGLSREPETTPDAVQFLDYDRRLNNGTTPDRAHAMNLP